MLRSQPAKREDFDLQPMPDDLIQVNWTRTFSPEEYRLLKLGYIPDISDYWLAFFEDTTFYVYWKLTEEFHISFQLQPLSEGYKAVNVQTQSKHALVQKMNEDMLIHHLNHLVDELLRWIELTEYPATYDHWKTIPMPEQKVKLDIELSI